MLVKNNCGAIHAGDLRPGVKVNGRNITVDGMHLPTVVGDNQQASLDRLCAGAWDGADWPERTRTPQVVLAKSKLTKGLKPQAITANAQQQAWLSEQDGYHRQPIGPYPYRKFPTKVLSVVCRKSSFRAQKRTERRKETESLLTIV